MSEFANAESGGTQLKSTWVTGAVCLATVLIAGIVIVDSRSRVSLQPQNRWSTRFPAVQFGSGRERDPRFIYRHDIVDADFNAEVAKLLLLLGSDFEVRDGVVYVDEALARDEEWCANITGKALFATGRK
jgi:hypothetical protein